MSPKTAFLFARPPEKLFGILGNPLGHSISPRLHTWGFAYSGFPGAYFAWPKTAVELPEFFNAVRSLPIHGLSVTIPHKQTVIPFLDELTPVAVQVGAVNTIYWNNGRLVGHNTDVHGFMTPLRSALANTSPPARDGLKDITEELKNVLILGAGGVCRAALFGLRELGYRKAYVVARDLRKAKPLARDFACDLIPWNQLYKTLDELQPALLINATPLGMRGSFEAECPVTEGQIAHLAKRARPLVYDLVYVPRKTILLQMAEQYGLPTQGGLEFFAAQGVEQFRLWTGHELPGDPALELIQTELYA